MYEDHGQALASHLFRLPMTVAEHRAWSVDGGGRLDLDDAALRLGQRKGARHVIAGDGLDVAVLEQAARHKRIEPRFGVFFLELISGEAASGPVGTHEMDLL